MIPCVAIFDIGKTNKKFLLFDQEYQIIKEEEVTLKEVSDDDGDPGEDINALTTWLLSTWKTIENDHQYQVLAVNFTTYGASFVHLDKNLKPVTPLYNYLKAFPTGLEQKFYNAYGDKDSIATETASPSLGMLNSGLQLYWLKYQKPEVFEKIKVSLHLPQFVSFLFTGKLVTDFTSLGCHTALWDFQRNDYHTWVYSEGIEKLFAPLHDHDKPFLIPFRSEKIPAGIGLHDSSSALIPYLKQYKEPFLLLSTGTWGITLNPFSEEPLSHHDLHQDCLLYLTWEGHPVKASRILIGNAHDEQTRNLASHYKKPLDFYKSVKYDENLLKDSFNFSPDENYLKTRKELKEGVKRINEVLSFNYSQYPTYEAAYHHLIYLLVCEQAASIFLAAERKVEKFKYLLVDGGFSRNPIFMALLRKIFPGLTVKAGKSAQGTSLGATLTMGDVFSSVKVP